MRAPPRAATASRPTLEIWGVLPDEFRAAAADLLAVSRRQRRADRRPRRGRGRRRVLPLAARSSTPRASPTRCASRADERRAAGAADRPRDRRAPSSATRSPPTATRACRGSELARVPGHVRPLDPGRDRLLGRPASSASSSATRSASRRRSPAPASATSSRSPTRRCRRRAAPATATRSAEPAKPATSSRIVPGPETDADAARRLPRRLRADDAPRRRRRALLLRRRLLRPHPRAPSAPGSRSPAPPTARSPPPRSPPRSDGFLHYYLSGSADSHLRDSPMKNVVARAGRARRRARPAAQPRRRHRPRRRARGVQARLRQPRAALAHLGAGLRRRAPTRELSRRPRRRRLLPRLPRLSASVGSVRSGSAGVGPVKVKASTGSPPYLPQVALPKARIASRVIAPLYFLQPSRLVQVVAATS